MRAVEQICTRRPNAQLVIVGCDDVSYAYRLPDGQCYREKLLKEVSIDISRVHFLGKITYQKYLKVLQVSSAHVYLTVPFALSWSMLEAMAASCLVIASDTPPVSEIIRNGENGLLVDFFSPTAIADAIGCVFQEADKMVSLRTAARHSISNSLMQ